MELSTEEGAGAPRQLLATTAVVRRCCWRQRSALLELVAAAGRIAAASAIRDVSTSLALSPACFCAAAPMCCILEENLLLLEQNQNQKHKHLS